MSLQREAILLRARDMLLWRTDAADAVFVNKAEPDQGADLPLVALYGISEKQGAIREESPRRFVRTLTLAVDVKVGDATSDGASLRLNRLCEQVERILLRDPLLPDAAGEPLANDLRWIGFELTLDSESRSVVNGAAITLEVDYLYEPELEAPANVRALLLVHAESTLGGVATGMADDVALQGG